MLTGQQSLSLRVSNSFKGKSVCRELCNSSPLVHRIMFRKMVLFFHPLTQSNSNFTSRVGDLLGQTQFYKPNIIIK